jgi:hypothetical protein
MITRRQINLLRSKTVVKTRDVEVLHRTLRGIRHRRLVVEASGEGVLVVGGHGDAERLVR